MDGLWQHEDNNGSIHEPKQRHIYPHNKNHTAQRDVACSLWMNPLNSKWHYSLVSNRPFWLRELNSTYKIWKNEPTKESNRLSLEERFQHILRVQKMELAMDHFSMDAIGEQDTLPLAIFPPHINSFSPIRFHQLLAGNPYYLLFVERYLKDRKLLKLLNKKFLSTRLEYTTKKHAVNQMGLDVLEVLRRESRRSKDMTFQYHANQIAPKLHIELMKRKFDALLKKENPTILDGQLLLCELLDVDTSDVEVFFVQCEFRARILLNLRHSSGTSLDQISQEQILETIDKVIFELNHFSRPAERDCYNTSNALISEAIRSRTGIPITICTIFEELYHRITGVHLLPRFSPMMFMLATPENPPTIINAFNQERLTPLECFEHFRFFDPTLVDFDKFEQQFISNTPPMADIYLQCVANLVNMYSMQRERQEGKLIALNAMTLHFHPSDPFSRLSLLEMTLLDDIEHSEEEIDKLKQTEYLGNLDALQLDDYLEKLEVLLKKEKEKLKKDELPAKKFKTIEKYDIGQVIVHAKYGYRGVICGYDPTCCMSTVWKQHMGVQGLPNGEKQPFYQVLVHTVDRPVESTYVAEDNITLCSDHFTVMPVSNSTVGRYFTAYDYETTRYIPNEKTQW
eukprot:CAMPEP_0117436232 /NCGR_PEP_ID=MMETSP0759-20121206/900_1 /TAXON_ID=63605 /ORGANISM="Percolomonas cosmopolitus, Strain WS" /LENGTH=625 /DNA_ID=CAMNT_0005227823 /DNA_START=88 /DNA_END=1962 /DNA_ORIENTATION=-